MDAIFKAERSLHKTGCIALAVFGPSVLISSFFLNAPYGRYSTKGWGPMISARLGWIIQESPSFLVPAFLLWLNQRPDLTNNPVHRVILGMYMFHYFYRSFVYPFFLNGKPAPLATVGSAVFFCLLNGYLQGRYWTFLAPAYPANWLTDPRFIFGGLTWFAGWLINFHSDHVLRHLRKPGETGYKIPKGGMFNYVSAANYFGEILEWVGYAIASWSLAGWTFALFCACFLGSRGYAHHQWYRKEFKTYPKDRKAVIPFIL